MRYLILVLAACSAACGTSKPVPQAEPSPQPELVTRQSPPMEPRPARTAATRVDVEAEKLEEIKMLLQSEASSAEVVTTTQLQWEDRRQTWAVTHVRYPTRDMPESGFERAVDQAAIARCDEEFPDCVDELDSCQDAAYATCVRSAYRDSFVYMSSELAVECGVYEFSVYEERDEGLTLVDRRALDQMACDFDHFPQTPAATDIDADGGPELVYAWYSSAESLTRETFPRESIAVVDANELHIQFRFTADIRQPDATDDSAVTGMEIQDVDEDGFGDVVLHRVETHGYCPQTGWALGAELVVPSDEVTEEYPCEMFVTRSVATYDPGRDTWVSEEPEAAEETE